MKLSACSPESIKLCLMAAPSVSCSFAGRSRARGHSFVHCQLDGFAASDGFKRAGVLTRLHHQNVNGQLQSRFNLVFEAGTVHDAGFARCLDKQVNISTPALVVEPGTIKPNLHAIAQHGGGGTFDGVNLGGGEAHGVVVQ